MTSAATLHSSPARYRVTAKGLSSGEAGLIRALIVLVAEDREGVTWEYSDRDADIEAADGPDSARIVLQGREGTMEWIERPITADRLQKALVRMLPTLQGMRPATPKHLAATHSPRYRLVKWPPAELTRGDRVRMKISALLSRNSLSLEDVVRLTSASSEQCATYLRSLRSLGLLVEVPKQAVPPTSATRREWSVGAERRTLVQRIRSKLGLARWAA